MTNRQNKCVDCIVRTDADVVDYMTHGRAIRHMVGLYNTWQVLVGRIVDELAFDTCH
jgi:hypothetical protein